MPALNRIRQLRATTIASTPATLGWGLMMVGFPLYAARTLHAGGYLWAALALGSIVGTFALAGGPSPRRIALYTASPVCPRSRGRSRTRSRSWASPGSSKDPRTRARSRCAQRHTPPAIRA